MNSRILMICFLAMAFASTAIAQNSLVEDKAAANLTNVSFKDVMAKECARVLVQNLGFKAQLDDKLDNGKITFELKNVTLAAALAVTVTLKEWHVKQLPEKTLMIIPDTEEARQRFAQYPDWSPKSAEK